MRVCRVRPDVPAVNRPFDYIVPDGWDVGVGTIVRVPLHGRRVRGWVVAVDVLPDTGPDRLRPLAKVVGAGPPPELVTLADWAAWRWAGSPVAFLRVASPPLIVPLAAGGDTPPAVARSTTGIPGRRPAGRSLHMGRDTAASARSTYPAGLLRDVTLHRWPPALPRAELVRDLVSPHGSTIVVLPEARRTGALVRALGGLRSVVVRGDLSAAARTAAWRVARDGDCVVVGGRTAVWAPVPDLAAVVVLDEGDEALKEERTPTWHAREVAVERARRLGAAAALISPAPTGEARAVATTTITPPRAVERRGWPSVEVVDRRKEPPGLGLLSPALADVLRRTRDRGGRSVCVLNRKGRARLLACAACGELARCEACGASVAEATIDQVGGGLVCARCGTTRPRVCIACHATRLKVVRSGVSRVRDDLAALLPRAVVAETDDSSGGVDVLIGTEAALHRVAAGTDRPVLVVAFLDFDQELLAPRVRAGEQALWLLVRAARVVGGRGGPGCVLVQTRVPGHTVIDAAVRGDPARAEVLYEPTVLAAVSGERAAVAALLAGLSVGAVDRRAIEVLGPVDEGTQALVRAPATRALCDALATAAPAARARGRLRIDVDPVRV